MNVYQIVTNEIIRQLKKGVVPWQKPWHDVPAFNLVSGKEYSLLNQLLLPKAGAYMTFRQAKAKGGTIEKGAKSSIVTFFKEYQDKNPMKDDDGNIIPDENGKPQYKKRYTLRYYRVFSVDDVEGIEQPERTELNDSLKPDRKAEIIANYYISKSGVKCHKDLNNQAFYSPAFDIISVPDIRQYDDIAEYYSTMYHEMVHSTGSEGRLNRFKSHKIAKFGSCDYSKEELIAEIGAAYLTRKAGLDTISSQKNSVAYISGWLKALESDERLIVKASAQAQKACHYILD